VIPAVATGAATVVVLVTLVAVVFGEDGSAPSKTAPAPQTVMSDAPRRLADGTAFVSKPSQRLLEVRTSPATTEEADRPSI
jgi:hypothetical protein